MTKECKNGIGIHGSSRILCLAEFPELHLYVFSRPLRTLKPFECSGTAVIEESVIVNNNFLFKTLSAKKLLSHTGVGFLKNFKRKKMKKKR